MTRTAGPPDHGQTYPINPFQYTRRMTHEVANFGGSNVPRVVADFSQVAVTEHSDLAPIGHFYLPVPDKWRMNDLGADYIYTGSQPAQFMLPNGLKEILDYARWRTVPDQTNTFPLLTADEYRSLRPVFGQLHDRLNFVRLSLPDWSDDLLNALREDPTVVLMATTANAHAMPELRRLFIELINQKLTTPVVVQRGYPDVPREDVPLYAATDVGGLLIDGLGDGILLSASDQPDADELKRLNGLAFGILQAARTRITKTEYISCPFFFRTLFDFHEKTALIRQRTDHLGQQVIKKSVPADRAVDELIDLIREDSRWIEPETVTYA